MQTTYSKTQLFREASKGVLFQEWADKLVDKTELLRGAHGQQVGQYPSTLATVTAFKVLASSRHQQVLAYFRIPLCLRLGRARACSRSRGRWRRASDLLLIQRLVEIGGGGAHARSRRASWGEPLL